MFDIQQYKKEIFHITSDQQFNDISIGIFHYQYSHNEIYRKFVQHLGRNPDEIHCPEEIPFLPIEFFKNHRIISGDGQPEITFTSSGTTGISPSSHYVTDLDLYQTSFVRGFELRYGNIQDYAIFALLPSYLERSGSSLVFMADKLIHLSKNPLSGFFLKHNVDLKEKMFQAQKDHFKVLLLGVSFALLELAESRMTLPENTIIMETGGMKGRRKELTRDELHQVLTQAFNVNCIHSEYGMTELLSQAYSLGSGKFLCPPWMKIMIRDTNDPLSLLPTGKTGGINIIDLANINSCSFIATQDLGKINENGSFEILGRFDESDIRGCNLLIE